MSIRRVIIYGLVGVSAFAVEYFSFMFLFNTIAAPYTLLIAQSVSFGFGLLVSYTGNRLFTFNDSHKTYINNVKKQIVFYLILAVVNLFLSNMIIYLLVRFLLVAPSISKITVMLMVVLWNYFIFNRLIFKTK